MKLTFCGGADTVTGANFLLETESTKILVDCGLEQGSAEANLSNRQPFSYDPEKIDALIITHAHMDHIGRVPKLVKDGFHGTIYSTPETRELAGPMLEDALKLLASEALHEGILPLYEETDIERTFNLWQTIEYHQDFEIFAGINIYLKDAGHVLGSAIVETNHQGEKIVFTGDLGNSPSPLLPNTENVTDADYLIMESVYGDRNHESREERVSKLAEIINGNFKRNGTLLIPTFSLEKTQVMLYELHQLINVKQIPAMPVYIDSPLALKLTEIYRRHPERLKPGVSFDFPNLHYVETIGESKHILNKPNPKMIIAGSGMSTGGRILQHEVNYLSDPNNTILFIGYQTAGTLGRQIEDGAREVEIAGAHVSVRARVEKINGFSSHKDSNHLVEFVEKTAATLKKCFVVMGETKSALFLAQRLHDYLGVNAYHPEQDESVELN